MDHATGSCLPRAARVGGRRMNTDSGNLLRHLDRAAIERAYGAAPGNEIASGKFLSRESSAALVANAFGLFVSTPERLPPLPGTPPSDGPARSVTLEAVVRFPWAGGRHPCLDVLIATDTALIGVESKRYEPFRKSAAPDFSNAYWRPVWGGRMAGYQQLRDQLRDGSLRFAHLDAPQLIKHALGLRTAARREGKQPRLIYLYAEPEAWPDGRVVSEEDILRHRQEIAFFAMRVRDDEVPFISLSYCQLLANWRSGDANLAAHADALHGHFAAQGADHAEPLWRRDESIPADPA